MIRLRHVSNTDIGLEIAYIDEADIHAPSGIIEARTIEIPHDALDSRLLHELVDAIMEILEDARVRRREVATEFKAPR